MDCEIFNGHTDVNACDCAWGCMDTETESALKVDWEKNPLPHTGIKHVLAACRSDALPTELHRNPWWEQQKQWHNSKHYFAETQNTISSLSFLSIFFLLLYLFFYSLLFSNFFLPYSATDMWFPEDKTHSPCKLKAIDLLRDKLTAELQRRIQAMEMRCYHKILRISYKYHFTNEEVCAKIKQAIGPHQDLLTIVRRHKLLWYGHVSHSSGLAKTILQGTVKEGEDKADRGKGGKTSGNEQAWSVPSPGGQWRTGKKCRKLVAKSSVVPLPPSRLRDRWWWWWNSRSGYPCCCSRSDSWERSWPLGRWKCGTSCSPLSPTRWNTVLPTPPSHR